MSRIEEGTTDKHLGAQPGSSAKVEDNDALIRSRASLKGQLTRYTTFFDGCDTLSRLEVEIRYEKFKLLWNKFENLQLQIESKGIELNANERIAFEDDYLRVDYVARTKIEQKRAYELTLLALEANPPAPAERPPFQQFVQLPKVKLPQFNGQMGNWISFWNQFEALIDSNATLSNLQKLIYLKSTLDGEAKTIIDVLSNSDQHYVEAVNLLKARYENRRILIYTHLQDIVSFESFKFCSVNGIRSLMDTVNKNLGALRGLGQNVDEWDTIIGYIILTKLDSKTREQLELENRGENVHTLGGILKYLGERCNALDNYTVSERNVVCRSPIKLSSNRLSCSFCNESHKIINCQKFQKLTPEGRNEFIKRNKNCLNCLCYGHKVAECKSMMTCRTCSKKHHSLLHLNIRSTLHSHVRNTNKEEAEFEGDVNTNNSQSQKLVSISKTTQKGDLVSGLSSVTLNDTTVLLLTAIVYVMDSSGNLLRCRVVLDSASESCFITEDLYKRLKLSISPTDVRVEGLGSQSTKVKGIGMVEVFSRFNTFSVKSRVIILPTITGSTPKQNINIDSFRAFERLSLADPKFYCSDRVDMLLSSDVFVNILTGNVLALENTKLRAIETMFGWVIGGRQTSEHLSKSVVAMCGSVTLSESIERFWKTEDVDFEQTKNFEDQSVERFRNEYSRMKDGRFMVPIFFETMNADFSHSYQFALNRFISLEKRLSRDDGLRRAYFQNFEEYIASGHMLPVSTNEYKSLTAYYIPHHAVVKESSTTTKIRVVFDGSSTFKGCTSLNSCVMTGMKLQGDLFGILLRARFHRIAILGDVEKMYRQIRYSPPYDTFLRVLWRNSPQEVIEEFALQTVTFGLTDAPFSALMCLRVLAEQEQESFPVASAVVLNNSYVDDFFSGSGDLNSATEMSRQLREMLDKGKFRIRKWISNSPEFLETIPMEDRYYESVELASENMLKVLGLHWDPVVDTFSCKTKVSITQANITKRMILSQIASLFDPLGWISPVIIRAKILMQKLWLSGVDWDDDLQADSDIFSEWKSFCHDLHRLNEVKISRFVCHLSLSKLIGFCDASELAYGACIYVVNDETSSLLCAKSKVAPLKKITLARLELCGAVHLIRLMLLVTRNLNLTMDSCTFFTDSEIVLSWLSKPSFHWKTFVANRVAFIQEHSQRLQWRHVRSALNPADVISRGVTASQLLEDKRWWNGPMSNSNMSNIETRCREYNNNIDCRKLKVKCLIGSLDHSIDRFSQYHALIRCYAHVLRFYHNIRCRHDRKINSLSAEDLEIALRKLIWYSQRKSFPETINRLSAAKQLKKSDNLRSLTPFLDAHGLLRVGGRLTHSCLAYNTKHPIIMGKHSRLSELIVEHEHRCNKHANFGTLQAIIRTKYWIVGSRVLIKRLMRKCLTCVRWNKIRIHQLMGSLPEERVAVSRPFLNVGVDFAGPFYVRPTRNRGNMTLKCYLALFICMSVKAVHFELVFDLTSESFLAALKRFISRRGRPSTIFSDNGTNFRGSDRLLRELYDAFDSENFVSDVERALSDERILWKFIPPGAPQFGGLWEASIKITKTAFYKCCSSERLSIEEFETLMIEIEGCLNSRPIWQTDETSLENEILTPSHFLIGTCLRSLPDTGVVEYKGNLAKRWRHVQYLLKAYWDRFIKEYITSLNQRSRNLSVQRNLKVGDFVLVSECTSPMKWPIARVCKVYYGSDNLVRVVKLKMGDSYLKRPVNKLCLLDFSNDKFEKAGEYVES